MTVAQDSIAASRKSLKRELAAVELKADEVFRALPDWWEGVMDHPSGVFEVKGVIAKLFGLDIGRDGMLCRRPMPEACFKTRKGTDAARMAPARAMATAVARLVGHAAVPPWSGRLPSPAEIRADFLENRRVPWIGLAELLAVCWENGVPVIYLPDVPVIGAKMDGLLTRCGERPVILVTKKISHPAWMLFILAHEMGHLALGHLDERDGGAIVDEKIAENDGGGGDSQEAEANRYALRLLTGAEVGAITLSQLSGRSLSRAMHMVSPLDPPFLARDAVVFGERNRIDPGHVILNVVNTAAVNGKAPWGKANAALKNIDDKGGAEAQCRCALRAHIDGGSLSDTNYEFLERVGLL